MQRTSPDKLKVALAALPKKPGCYIFRGADGEVLYVGKAKLLRSRVRSYFQSGAHSSNPAKLSMVRKICDLETVIVGSELEALILESTLIKKYSPRYNVLLKDDKSYLFIKVTTQEDFPQVLTVRRVVKDGARYFGPFTNSFAVRETLKLMQRIFPYRTCDLPLAEGQIAGHGFRPCLRYHLGRCDAPCIEGVDKATYRAAIDRALLFLEGKLDVVRTDLLREMHEAARAQDYERAARLRDQVRQLEHLQKKQVVLSPRFTNQDVVGFVTDRRRTRAYASLIMVRDGRVLGTEHFELKVDPSSSDEDVVRALVLQRYSEATFVPRELLLPVRLADAAVVERLLRQRAASIGLAHAVRVRTPRSGQAKRLVAMAEENALEFRARKTVELAVDEAGTHVALERLGRELGLPANARSQRRARGPERVEIYDISNIQGTSAVGSMVVFVQGKPSKADYRRFKIATLREEPNDVGMLKEVLRRRLSRLVAEDPRWPRPDLIIVDGGKPQLNAARQVWKELDVDVPLAALAKREEELFVPGRATPIVLPRGSSALHLVQRMRDEAHRFAITFHRQLRSARTRRSLLDEVVGIGPARKKLLLQRYGSVEALSDASETELGKLIGTRAARALLEQLR